MQVCKYRDRFLKHYLGLNEDSEIKFHVINPLCLVIIGNTKELIAGGELTAKHKLESFDLYRSSLRDVQVITFDELFAKTETLVDILEGKTSEPRP